MSSPDSNLAICASSPRRAAGRRRRRCRCRRPGRRVELLAPPNKYEKRPIVARNFRVVGAPSVWSSAKACARSRAESKFATMLLLSLGVAGPASPVRQRPPPAPPTPASRNSAGRPTPTRSTTTRLGTALGAHFKATIQARFADLRAHGQLGQMLQTYNTSAGSALCDGFLKAHERLARRRSPSSAASRRARRCHSSRSFCRTSRSSSPTAARRRPRAAAAAARRPLLRLSAVRPGGRVRRRPQRGQ